MTIKMMTTMMTMMTMMMMIMIMMMMMMMIDGADDAGVDQTHGLGKLHPPPPQTEKQE